MKEITLWRDFDKRIENSFKDFNRNLHNKNNYEDFNSDDFVIQRFSEPIDVNSFNWEYVLIDSSKKLVDFGVKLIADNSNLFPSLLKLALSEKKQVSQRASRVIYYSIEQNLYKYDEYLDEILHSLMYIKDESLIFNLLRVFTISKLPEDDDLEFLTVYCFNTLNNNREKIAAKAYSMDILLRITKINPEIRDELKNYLKIYKDDNSTGLACRASKLLFELNKV
jgi:hypothetical protein